MKKGILALLLGLLALGSLAACGQSASEPGKEPAPEETAAGELSVMAAQGSGTPLPADTSYEKRSFLTEGDGWQYYQGTVSYEGQTFAAVWREGEEVQSLCSIHQPQGENAPQHEISCQSGAEASGGRFLYFTIRSGATGEKSLWMLDTQAIRFREMYAAPCSNLVIPRDPGPDWQGLGWVVHDRWLLPINLDQGSEYTAGIQELPQSPFAGEDGAARQVELAEAGDHLLQLVLAPGTDQEKQTTVNYTNGAAAE